VCPGLDLLHFARGEEGVGRLCVGKAGGFWIFLVFGFFQPGLNPVSNPALDVSQITT